MDRGYFDDAKITRLSWICCRREDEMNRLPVNHEALTRLCRRHHIVRLSLFGSVLRGESGPGSDVDLLVEFQPGAEPGLLGLAAIEMELATLLEGRRVDLRTAQDLSRHFRAEVVRAAELQYAT